MASHRVKLRDAQRIGRYHREILTDEDARCGWTSFVDTISSKMAPTCRRLSNRLNIDYQREAEYASSERCVKSCGPRLYSMSLRHSRRFSTRSRRQSSFHTHRLAYLLSLISQHSTQWFAVNWYRTHSFISMSCGSARTLWVVRTFYSARLPGERGADDNVLEFGTSRFCV